MTKMPFRNDINGLRAWAVIAVVLYHFGVPGASGGFAGVDVFFVISGYLMTGIIVSRLEAGLRTGPGFRLIEFYISRACRILPALTVLIVVLLLLGWWLLPTAFDYRTLGSEAVAAATMLSNYKYWMNDGAGHYFAETSDLRWLLHTWSLSVEWQFYLLLPLLLLLVWKIMPARGALAAVLALFALVSYLASGLTTATEQSLAFYSLHTRAWEMLVGGLVFLWVPQTLRSVVRARALEIAGFTLIAYAIVSPPGLDAWPGWAVAIPVSGSVLVLVAGRSASVLTAPRLLQFIGTISYSLYLWHWPVAVSLGYLGVAGALGWIVVGIVVSGLLAVLSYRVVERPCRIGLRALRPVRFAMVGAAMVLLPAVAGLVIHQTGGVPGRMTPVMSKIAAQKYNFSDRREDCMADTDGTPRPCSFGGDHLAVVLLGDSHAGAIVTGLAHALPSERDRVELWAKAGCPTVLGAQHNAACTTFLKAAVAHIEALPATVPVVITNRFSSPIFGRNEKPSQANRPAIHFGIHFAEVTPELLAQFEHHQIDTWCSMARTRPVFVTRPIPEMGFEVPRAAALRAALGLEGEVAISRPSHDARQAFIISVQDKAAAQCGIRIIDLAQATCSQVQCFGTLGGVPVYTDNNHLSLRGADLLTPIFRTALGK